MQAIALAEEDVRALDSSEAAQLPTIGEPVSPEASPEASPRRTMQFIQSHERRMRERLRAAGEKDATGESSSGITRKVRANPPSFGARDARGARAVSTITDEPAGYPAARPAGDEAHAQFSHGAPRKTHGRQSCLPPCLVFCSRVPLCAAR